MTRLRARTPSPRYVTAGGGGPARRTDPGPSADREATPPSVWAALCPPGTLTVALADAARVLPLLAPGTPVAVVTSRPLARGTLRRLCERSGVRIDRELVALPSGARPLVLFDDHPETVACFWNGVATVPPAPGWVTAPATLVLALGARAPWRWTGALAPGRVLLGTRR